MAITKTIIKLNHIEAIVKIVNDAASAASSTITLNTDLLKSNEVLSGATPAVHLSATETSVPPGGEISITRDGTVICNYFENNVGFELPWGADTQNPTSDIVVSFTLKGTIYLRLLKVAGYRPTFRPEQGVN